MSNKACCFTLGQDDVPPTWTYQGFDCSREAWENSDWCILHDSSDEKPLREVLKAMQDGRPLDGARLAEVGFPEGIDLRERSMVQADLTGATLEGAQLALADLRGARLVGADLRQATITEATLTGADLREARLNRVDLAEAVLYATNLEGAILGQALMRDAAMRLTEMADADAASANLSGADLRGAILKGVDLGDGSLEEAELADADLRETDLVNANLTNADATQADLQGSDLERADLRGAKLFDANLEETRLYGALLTDVQLNDATTVSLAYEGNEALGKAASTYRRLERLMQDNAQDARRWEMFVRRQETEREALRVQGDVVGYHLRGLWRAISGYGSSPARVASTSLGLILTCALLYPIFGLSLPAQDRTLSYWSAWPDALEIGFTVFESTYFSAITFTTVGYGEILPANGGAQALATVETLLGGFLMALFVFVLGRRTT